MQLKKSSKEIIYSSFNYSRGSIDRPADIAEEFNKFFCDIGTNLASALPRGQKYFSTYLRGTFPKSMYLNPVMHSEIINLIMSLRKTGSTGPDGISVKIIQLAINFI